MDNRLSDDTLEKVSGGDGIFQNSKKTEDKAVYNPENLADAVLRERVSPEDADCKIGR